MEQLEARRVLASILLEIPGINGDAVGAGASATDIELTSFSWGFARSTDQQKSSAADPIKMEDLKFTKSLDSASNDLYAQANFTPIYNTATKLRIVDDAASPPKTVLSLNLGSGRLTSYAASDKEEKGSLSFGKVDFSESIATIGGAVSRTASWDLLTGAVTNSAIVGSAKVDSAPAPNSLNIETVLEIGGQKLLIDGYSWKAFADGDVLDLPSSLTAAKGGQFQISRAVDSGTAGLLGNAAAGTNLGTIKISDRQLVGGINKIAMEWKLYDAVVGDFGLSFDVNGTPINKLGFSFSKIELVASDFEAKSAGTTLTTVWDEAGKVVSSASNFGTVDPAIADAVPVASYLDFGSLGRVRYDSIDWSIKKPNEGTNKFQLGKTSVDPIKVALKGGASTPALMGSLAKLSVLPTVAALEKNTVDLSSNLDSFTLTKAAVTHMAVVSEGLDDPQVVLGLDFQSVSEAFEARSVPLTTTVNFNEATETSSGVLSFGAQSVDTLFELSITEDNITSEIPVISAKWNVDGAIERRSANDINIGNISNLGFDLKVPRGVHSPGLLSAATRGTFLDKVVLRKYAVVGENKVETYQWALTQATIASMNSRTIPGNSADGEEVDSISLIPKIIELRIPQITEVVNGETKEIQKASSAGFDYIVSTGIGGGGIQYPEIKEKQTSPFLLAGLRNTTFVIDSFSWGAELPVVSTTATGQREPGSPTYSDLRFSVAGTPSPGMLDQLLKKTPFDKAEIFSPNVGNSQSNQSSYKFELAGLASSYSYSDQVDKLSASNSLGLFARKSTIENKSLDQFGQIISKQSVTLDTANNSLTTLVGGFGGFQFAANSSPARVLEFFDGTTGGQVELDEFSFSTSNSAVQVVGTKQASTQIAPRGVSKLDTFNVTTEFGSTSPALVAAIALKSKLPTVKITERRNTLVAGTIQFVPYREWILKDVFVENLTNSATKDAPIGPVGLKLNPASVSSTLISYGKDGQPIRAERKLEFFTPPVSKSLSTISAVSIDPDRVVGLANFFTDEQEASSTLRYSHAVLSGGNLFDSVAINSSNQLVLNFKPGQFGLAQIQLKATDSFGQESTLIANVALDADGINKAPEGTNATVTTNEDLAYTIKAVDFGFTDPDDFPANSFTGVRVSSLPSKGSLTLNNAAVSANQIIPILSINSNLLRYTPPADANGNNLTSFTFQVMDNGATSQLDPTPNLMSLNVTPTNDAPVITSENISMPPVVEDSLNHNGMLVSSIANNFIVDIDAAAVKGIAVVSAPSTAGTWQYALDGINWQSLTGVSSSAARLLPSDASTRLRFIPNANFAGVSTLKFHAWDRTSGPIGGIGSIVDLAATKTFSTTNANLNVTVTPVNDAPNLANTPVSLVNVNEDTASPAGTRVLSLLAGMSDTDSGALKGIAVLEVQNSSGIWQYSLNGGVSWLPFGNVSGSAARLLPADANTRVRFVPTINFAGTRIFSFVAWDRTTGVAGGTATISAATSGGSSAFSSTSAVAVQQIVAVNDTPNITAPSLVNALTNTPVVFSAANANSLSISDVDAGSSVMQVALSTAFGKISLSTLAGLTVTGGSNGTSSLTVRGSLAALNTALDGASFDPTANFFGPATLQMTVNDLGNTGVGDAQSRFRSINLNVKAINLGSLDSTNTMVHQNGSVGASSTVHRIYSFTTGATGDVRVALSGLTATANLFLLSASGQNLGQTAVAGPGIKNLVATGLAAGTYYVSVVPSGTATNFNLAVSSVLSSDDVISSATSLGTLSSNGVPTTVVSGAVGGVNDKHDYYTLSTAGISNLRVNLSGMNANAEVQLLDGNGVILTSGVQSGTSIENISRSNLLPGNYFIRVFIAAGQPLAQYTLTVSAVSDSDDLISNAFNLGTPNVSAPATVRRGGVSVGGTADLQDFYRFDLGATSSVRINLTGLSADLEFNLMNQFGQTIASGSRAGNSIEDITQSDMAIGTYFVRVFSFNGSTSSYELAISTNPSSDDLLVNAINLGSINTSIASVQRADSGGNSSDPTDYFKFTLDATASVRVNLSGLSGDADITLEDSFGRSIAASTFGGATIDNLIGTDLPAGTYFVKVQTLAASTNYILTASRIVDGDDLISNATALGTLNSSSLPSVARDGSAGSGDFQDYFQFDLATSGNLRLALSKMTTDLDIELLDQFGQIISVGVQSGNTIERVTTPVLAIGRYYIRVYQLFAGAVSNYRMELTTNFSGDDEINGGLSLGTLASSPLVSNGTVGGNTDIQDYFSFTLTSTRNVRFQLTGLSADLDIQVLDSFGRVVGAGAAGSSTPEDFTLNGLLPGKYFIRVFPFAGATSNYSLSVAGV